VVVSPVPGAAQDHLRTAAEASDFERHTRHGEMWDYLEALRASSPEMRLGVYGETWEGRRLPYAVFSRPQVTQPWEAWALDRPVLVLAANVHGNERTLRESLLILMREFATPGTEAWALLDRVVVVAVPQINPDGFEASERGTRGNVRGIDLNRDYVKLEHPEVAAFVGNIIQEWQPHLFVDGHNGGSYPYNLNYQCPSHADADPRITDMCDDEIFPAIDARLATEGFESFFYARGDEEEWRAGGNQARIGRNYGGFINAAGILFESPPRGQTLAEATRAGHLGYLAVVEWAATHPDRLRETIREARLETVRRGLEADGEVVVEMEYEAEEDPVTYKIARRPADVPEGEEITTEELEIVTVEEGRLMKRPVPLRTRPLPYAYVLPPEAREAVEMLRRHDITVEVMEDEMELTVDAYTLAGVSYERAYDHAAATRVTVGEVRTVERTFPAGAFVVPTGQMLGRLVAHMMEPESSDNIVYWNTMDAWLPKPAVEDPPEADDEPALIPIYKIMEPRALPTRLLRSGG
jgi:hypothetical protein